VPPWIRDPDSGFSAFWDTLSVVFLLYVTATVPVRACFGVEDVLWSASFWFDLVVDLFFISGACSFGLTFAHAEALWTD